MAGSCPFVSLAVITGGGSGIGRSVCRILAREKVLPSIVVVADISIEAAENTLRELEGPDHCALQVNVADRQSVTSLFSKIKNRYNRSPDVLVNCAGIHQRRKLFEITDDDFENLINVNLKGTFLMTQETCRHIVEEKMDAASIVNISSIAASLAQENVAIYSATKGGIESFTRAVALEMAPHKIRINAVRPGSVDTPMAQKVIQECPELMTKIVEMIPKGRLARPEEVAEVCAFLTFCKSSYMTGAVVPVTGGFGM